MKEIWKDINGYEGQYQISNTGIVRSLNRVAVYIDNRDRPICGQLLSKNLRDVYYHVDLYNDGIRKQIRIHRLVAIAFIPNPENKPQINHIDGNKLNNNVDNLEWVTHKENAEHAINTGLSKSGENCSYSILTNDIVLLARKMYVPRVVTVEMIADYFGVKEHTMYCAIKRITWKRI